MKNRKKTELPVSHGIPLKKINLKVYPNFSIVGCFFTSDGQFFFWPVLLNPTQEKINPEVHPLKFASFLSPIVSHLDSRHLSYPYGPPQGSTPSPLLPTHSLCPPCSIPAHRKNSAAFQLPRHHAWPTYNLQNMPGNLVFNSK